MVNQRWLKTALLAEVPVLIVTLALLSWAPYALNDASTYLGILHQNDSLPNKHRAKYGLDLGTQIVTLTTTYTGATDLYSPVIVYATRTRSHTTVVVPWTSDRFVGSTSGTVTATETSELYPGFIGTAPYGDGYSQAQVNPSSLKVWSSGEYDAYLTSAGLLPSTLGVPPVSSRTKTTSVPMSTATPAPEKRDGSWSEGYTYDAVENGLYNDSPDDVYFLPLWLGTFAACLAVIVLRLIVNIAYVCMAPRKPTAMLLLCSAAIAFPVLCGCGITAWYYFINIQHFTAAEVRATFAVYVVSTVASLGILIFGACELQRYKREERLERKGSINSEVIDSGEVDREEVDHASTASGHQYAAGYEK